MDYISVPVVPELLRARVSVFAKLHRKTRQLEQLNKGFEARVQERTEEISWLNNQLDQRLAEFETIMQMLPVGVAVTQDPACMEIIANPALDELLGVSPEHSLRQALPRRAGRRACFTSRASRSNGMPDHCIVRLARANSSAVSSSRFVAPRGAAAGFAHHAADAWLLSRVEGPGGSGAA